MCPKGGHGRVPRCQKVCPMHSTCCCFGRTIQRHNSPKGNRRRADNEIWVGSTFWHRASDRVGTSCTFDAACPLTSDYLLIHPTAQCLFRIDRSIDLSAYLSHFIYFLTSLACGTLALTTAEQNNHASRCLGVSIATRDRYPIARSGP